MLNTKNELAIPVIDVGDRLRYQQQNIPHSHLSGIHDGVIILLNHSTSEMNTHNSFEMTSHNALTNRTHVPTGSLVTGEVPGSVKCKFSTDNSLSHGGQMVNCSEKNLIEDRTQRSNSAEILSTETKLDNHHKDSAGHLQFESNFSSMTNSISNKSHKKMNDSSNIFEENDSSCDLSYSSVVMETSVDSASQVIINNRKRHASLEEAEFHSPSKLQRGDVEENKLDHRSKSLQFKQNEQFVTDGCHGDTKKCQSMVNGEKRSHTLPLHTGISYSEAKSYSATEAFNNADLDQSEISLYIQPTNDFDDLSPDAEENEEYDNVNTNENLENFNTVPGGFSNCSQKFLEELWRVSKLENSSSVTGKGNGPLCEQKSSMDPVNQSRLADCNDFRIAHNKCPISQQRRHKKQMFYRTRNKTYICSSCRFETARILDMLSHAKKGHRHRYECNTCVKVFHSKFLLRSHQVIKHEGIISYQCCHCGNIYQALREYREHSHKVHGQESVKSRRHLYMDIQTGTHIVHHPPGDKTKVQSRGRGSEYVEGGKHETFVNDSARSSKDFVEKDLHCKESKQVLEKTQENASNYLDGEIGKFTLIGNCGENLTKVIPHQFSKMAHRRFPSEQNGEDETPQTACNVCFVQFYNRRNLKYHKRKHRKNISDGTYCHMCGRTVSKASINRHFRMCILNVCGENTNRKGTLCCRMCGLLQPSNSALLNHLILVHGNKEKYKCQCGRTFSAKSLLYCHFRYCLLRHDLVSNSPMSYKLNVCKSSIHHVEETKQKQIAPTNNTNGPVPIGLRDTENAHVILIEEETIDKGEITADQQVYFSNKVVNKAPNVADNNEKLYDIFTHNGNCDVKTSASVPDEGNVLLQKNVRSAIDSDRKQTRTNTLSLEEVTHVTAAKHNVDNASLPGVAIVSEMLPTAERCKEYAVSIHNGNISESNLGHEEILHDRPVPNNDEKIYSTAMVKQEPLDMESEYTSQVNEANSSSLYRDAPVPNRKVSNTAVVDLSNIHLLDQSPKSRNDKLPSRRDENKSLQTEGPPKDITLGENSSVEPVLHKPDDIVRINMIGNRFQCPRCFVSFKSQSELVEHFYSKCRNRAVNHILKEAGSFFCKSCSLHFSDFDKYRVHCWTRHQEKKQGFIPCRICGQLFMSEAYLREHMQGKHNTVGRYSCTCGKKFKWRSSFCGHKKKCNGTISLTRQFSMIKAPRNTFKKQSVMELSLLENEKRKIQLNNGRKHHPHVGRNNDNAIERNGARILGQNSGTQSTRGELKQQYVNQEVISNTGGSIQEYNKKMEKVGFVEKEWRRSLPSIRNIMGSSKAQKFVESLKEKSEMHQRNRKASDQQQRLQSETLVNPPRKVQQIEYQATVPTNSMVPNFPHNTVLNLSNVETLVKDISHKLSTRMKGKYELNNKTSLSRTVDCDTREPSSMEIKTEPVDFQKPLELSSRIKMEATSTPVSSYGGSNTTKSVVPVGEVIANAFHFPNYQQRIPAPVRRMTNASVEVSSASQSQYDISKLNRNNIHTNNLYATDSTKNIQPISRLLHPISLKGNESFQGNIPNTSAARTFSNNPVLKFKCTLCSSWFPSKWLQEKHTKTCGRGKSDSQINCNICGILLRGKANLREHMLGKHGHQNRYSCPCGMKFKWRSSLACHQKSCSESIKSSKRSYRPYSITPT